MSFSPQSKQDFSQYGFSPEDESVVNQNKNSGLDDKAFTQPNPNMSQNAQQPTADYSQYGFDADMEKPKEKVGWAKSILYGLAEGVLGIPALVQYGVNEWSKPLEQLAYGEESPQIPFEQENPILNFTSQFPESEDETARRVRTGTAGAITGAPFGIPGIIAGLVGSQAGQTIREVYGKEGKFDEFGWGEGAAIAADVLAGGAAGVATSLARGTTRAANQASQQISRTPAIFQQPQNALQRAVVKNTIQGEKTALENIINNFGAQQVRGFEQEAAALSPNRYTELINSHASGIQQQADNMFRNSQLSLISPFATTPEQGGRAIQEAANSVFNSNVIQAERSAYGAAREAAQGIVGEAPRTIEQAKTLLAELTKNAPTPEQQPLITFLEGLIGDLETVTPASTTPASKILDASGKPVLPAQQIAPSSTPTPRSANDLVDLVQKANQAVNYDGELRYQSHRLKPLVNTLRQEVGQTLNKNPTAASLYQQANDLHAHNAETWGTKYMRNVRFAENPETLVGKTKVASNMRNLKNAIDDPAIQGLAERLAIEDITRSGSPSSNRSAIAALAPELRLEARNAAQELVNVKDPLTTSGGRAAVRNQILKDAAQSVNTGKRPEQILNLMQTPKGYNLVRESLRASPESRRLFESFERLFIEDIFSSITDSTGQIDFKKARNIFKNRDVRQVTEEIGGPRLVGRFNELETFANSFDRNLNLYKSPETQSLFKKVVAEGKNAGLVGLVLHSLHVPIEIIAGLGLLKATAGVSKVGFKAIQDAVLSNPKAVRALEAISRATTTEELAKQLPRFLKEIEVSNDEEKP